MNKRRIFQKTIAWALITTMINPAFLAPAFARDSDIYLQTTTGTSAAEPNVLFILGTNDRMNVAEAWREYDPDVYDSHAEYLWNDISIINGSNFATGSESSIRISTASPPVNPTSPWGTWAGGTPTERSDLWKAVKTYATGKQGGDPVARSTLRNYWNGSWVYWLPAGSDIATDQRLWSTSYNRFQAHIQTAPGTRGNVVFPDVNAPFPYNGANGTTADYRAFNLCSGAISQITPSTVFAPTDTPMNVGFYLNQQWVRYEPYLNLTAVNSPATNYPGDHTTAFGGTNNTSAAPSIATFYRGYVDGVSGAPTNTAVAPPTNVYRDSWTSPADNPVVGGRQGQPIRIQGSGFAGWADVKADLGGFVFQSYVANSNGYYYPALELTRLRTLAYANSYNLIAAGNANGANPLELEQFSAWKGNRDGAPAFGSMVGTPAYYDVTVGSCNPSTGPAVANQCIAYGSGSVGVVSRNCSVGGTALQERDASTAIRFTGGTCADSGPPTCTIDGVSQPLASCTSAGITPPTCALQTQDTFFSRFYESNCGFSGQSTVAVATCQWTGRQSVLIEGQGTYFYGGTCTESGSTASCNAGGTTRSLNGTPQANVVGPYVGSIPASASTSDGCTNVVAAGSYNYGGTCGGGSEFKMLGAPSPVGSTPGSPGARALTVPTECTGPSGGTSTSIRGGPTRTYNQSCTNTFPSGGTCSAWYGAPCIVSNVPAAYCPPVQQSTGPIGPARYYQAYKQQENQPNLYHECLADGPTQGRFPTRINRAFATAANSTTAADTAGNLTAAYSSNASQGVTADAAKNIDVYSVNYLNFKFGAKACRDKNNVAIATGNPMLVTSGTIDTPASNLVCRPIARKTRLQVAKDALSGIVGITGGVRLGLMVYNKTDGGPGNSEGGNVVYAIRRMGADATDTPAYDNRANLVKAIQSVVASSRTPLTESLYEAYRYFSGRSPKFGTLTTAVAASAGGGIVSAGRETTVGANIDPPGVASNVSLINGTGAYNSPMLNNPTVYKPANCQKNYIVMITNGQPEDDFSANDDIRGSSPDKAMQWTDVTKNVVSTRTDVDSTGAKGSSYNQIAVIAGSDPYGPVDLAGTTSDGGFIWLDELSYFLAFADVSPDVSHVVGDEFKDGKDLLIPGRQSIITYTIGFAGDTAPVVRNAANVTKGVYYVAQDAEQLKSALVAAFTAIRDWNPTVAAATVPISALNRGQSSTDVYLAFFAPSVQSTWPGTVKKYQLSTLASDCGTTAGLCLTGQTVLSSGLRNIEKQSLNGGLAEVDSNAVSGQNSDNTAWTPVSVVDGASSTQGGTGYVLRNTAGYTPDTRKVYTFLSGGASSSVALTAAGNRMHFDNGAITKAQLGNAGMSDATRETLINFIRGGDLGQTECTDGSAGTVCTKWGTWPHFGTEHSRPVVVTYDSSIRPLPDQYLFYVQNNGMLTAVDTATGKEKWSFLIEEALPKLSELRDNKNGPELYIADGSPEVFFDDQNGNGKVDGSDRVWLFFGLRRGGRVIYAIDITQKDAPAFKWKITANGGTGKVCNGTGACASVPAFNELGQTWSTPYVARIRKLAASGDPALIFGGGYDEAEDTVPPGTRTMGRALYVINGNTAAIIKAWGNGQSAITFGSNLSYAIPSDVTAISTDLDPFIDRVYVGDLGGNVWRFDIDDINESNWQGEQLASLSNGSGEKRKFFFPPAVAPQKAPFNDPFDAVYIGSGDKEHPLLTSKSTPPTTDDRMFMLIDDHSLRASGRSGNPANSALPITLGSLLTIANDKVDVLASDFVSYQGWMRSLDDGEKVINAPSVFFDVLRFGTFAPLVSPNDCTPPGTGRLNELNALTGSFLHTNFTPLGAYQRWASGFLSAGFMSSTQLLTLQTTSGVSVFDFTCAGAACTSRDSRKLGAPTKVYWYMEPEQ